MRGCNFLRYFTPETNGNCNGSSSSNGKGSSNGKSSRSGIDPSSQLCLRNLNCSIARGELVGVVGNMGSGKSTFLQVSVLRKYYAFRDSAVTVNGDADLKLLCGVARKKFANLDCNKDKNSPDIPGCRKLETDT